MTRRRKPSFPPLGTAARDAEPPAAAAPATAAEAPGATREEALVRLRREAFALFGRHGLDGVAVSDIARATGLSKGALYWHFASKEELYQDCLSSLHDIFRHYVFGPARGAPSPLAGLLAIFAGVQGCLNDPRLTEGIAGYWLTPGKAQSPGIVAAQRAFEAECTAGLLDLLAAAEDAGVLALDADRADMARAIMALVEAMVLPLRHQEPAEVAATLRVLMRTLFQAYGPPGLWAAIQPQRPVA